MIVKEKALYLFRIIFISVLILSGIQDGIAQKKSNIITRYWHHLVKDTTPTSQPQLLIYPTVAYSPETSWEFGLSSLYVFYAKRDTTNRLSEINGFTFFTLENQYGIWSDHALYSHKNKWFLLGRWRLQSFPILYFGIGPEAPADYLAVVDANQIQVKERVLRRIYHNLYLGIEMDFQRLSSVTFHQQIDSPIQMPLGYQGSSNIGFGSGIIYDNRHNVLNVRHGFFSELALLRYDNLWGSDFSFTSILTDTRFYKSVNKRDVFATQLVGQFNSGTTPFNQLALLGGESIMRGYYLGRFRDRNLIAAQAEYRFLPLPLGFTKRLGAALFVGTGTVFNERQNFNLSNFVVSGGGGLRFLIFPKKDVFTRLDVAFTREGHGFYIFIGEAF